MTDDSASRPSSNPGQRSVFGLRKKTELPRSPFSTAGLKEARPLAEVVNQPPAETPVPVPHRQVESGEVPEGVLAVRKRVADRIYTLQNRITWKGMLVAPVAAAVTVPLFVLTYKWLGFGVIAGVLRLLMAHGAGLAIGKGSNAFGGRGTRSGYLCGALFLLSILAGKVYVYTVLSTLPEDLPSIVLGFVRFYLRTVTLLDLFHLLLGLAVAYHTGAAQDLEYEFLEQQSWHWRWWHRLTGRW